MESKKELAQSYFKQGYNCAQSVLLAYAEDYHIDEETAVRLSAGFGGGMGRMREVCGAVTAMAMIAGLENGTLNPKDIQARKKNYELVRELSRHFKEKNGSIVCRELLGLNRTGSKGAEEKNKDGYEVSAKPEERTEEYYKKRPCLDLVGDACSIIDELISPGGKET